MTEIQAVIVFRYLITEPEYLGLFPFGPNGAGMVQWKRKASGKKYITTGFLLPSVYFTDTSAGYEDLFLKNYPQVRGFEE